MLPMELQIANIGADTTQVWTVQGTQRLISYSEYREDGIPNTVFIDHIMMSLRWGLVTDSLHQLWQITRPWNEIQKQQNASKDVKKAPNDGTAILYEHVVGRNLRHLETMQSNGK